MLRFDGFRAITPGDVAEVGNNFERNVNEFSPFSTAVLAGPDDWVVDSFFGQVYTGVSECSRGIYGTTTEISDYPEDRLANLGHLRVPFRKVPRVAVKSKSDLSAIVDSLRLVNGTHLELLFRGQHTEYTLNRSEETRVFLYGDERAVEPSLLASAVRSAVDMDEFMLEWTFLLKIYFARHMDQLSDTLRNSERADIFREHERFQWSFVQELFSLALAQHYGLPSVGLDLSSELDIALFFAFNRFVREEKRSPFARYERVHAAKTLPVLYVIACQDRFQLDYRRLKPRSFHTARPDAQRARFMHSGWGWNRNYAAKRILVAFYLDFSRSEVDSLPKADDLFPHLEADPFARFLLETRDSLPNNILDPFYALQ